MNRRPNQVASGAGLVGEERGRDLDAPPVRLLDADVGDPDAGGDHDPVRRGVEVVELAHLAQVVVAPREVEQEVPDAVDPEAAAGAPQDGGGGEPGQAHGLVEELDGIGGCLDDDLRLQRAAAPRGGVGSGPRAVAHSAEIRYR